MRRFSLRRIPVPLRMGLAALVVLYAAFGVYLGSMIKEIMTSAFEAEAYAVNNPYSDIISDEYYNRYVHRARHDFSQPGASYEYQLSPLPVVVHWFAGARVCIWYDDHYEDDTGRMSGSSGVPVLFTLAWQDGGWRVVDFYEAP